LQIGRAGRDGSESYCHLFLDDADFLRLRSLAQSDGIETSNALSLVQTVFHQPGESHVGTAEDERGNKPLYGTVAVARVAEECDMKEEVMETLLSYLEVTIHHVHAQSSGWDQLHQPPLNPSLTPPALVPLSGGYAWHNDSKQHSPAISQHLDRWT